MAPYLAVALVAVGFFWCGLAVGWRLARSVSTPFGRRLDDAAARRYADSATTSSLHRVDF